MNNPTPSRRKNTTRTNLQRSLKYYQKGTLNPEAWFAVVADDYQKIIQAIQWTHVFPPQHPEHQLLDIGCGIGRFPTMLREHLSPDPTIHYDFLDPSQFCLTSCKQNLQRPFQPRSSWQTTLEHAESVLPKGQYDVVWAIQSLYCLNHDSQQESIKLMLQTAHPSRGLICIMLAKQDSFFSNVQRIFFQQSPEPPPPPYVNAETVLQTLGQLGAVSISRELPCVHQIPTHQDRLLEQYLQQSVMDSTPLPHWKKIPALRDFLESFRHGDFYHFPNPYWVILSIPGSAGSIGKHRLQSYFRPLEAR